MTGDAPPGAYTEVMAALVIRQQPLEDTITEARALQEVPARTCPAVLLTRSHLLAALDDCGAGGCSETELRVWAQALRLLDVRWSQPDRLRVFALDPGDRDPVAHVVYTLAAERHHPYPAGMLDDLGHLLRVLPRGSARIDWDRHLERAQGTTRRRRRLFGLTAGLGLPALALALPLAPAITAVLRAQPYVTTVADAFAWLP
ncbi:hypothetical protein [Glycomyces sp. MUSA5-2]|uniref:hypothetical protein n=1 Tax=Glycomyces sp. MUSA5-2 TaxID=2053002 RepID=UPI00300851B5